MALSLQSTRSPPHGTSEAQTKSFFLSLYGHSAEHEAEAHRQGGAALMAYPASHSLPCSRLQLPPLASSPGGGSGGSARANSGFRPLGSGCPA